MITLNLDTHGDEIIFRTGEDIWHVYYDPKPIPNRLYDWSYRHDDYDGAPDAYDGQHGWGETLMDCINQIKEYHEEQQQ